LSRCHEPVVGFQLTFDALSMSSCVTFWTNSRGVIYHSREDLCIFTWPREARLVALISGYFDDSQAAGDVWVVAGYVGYANQWDHFELLWKEVLQIHGVPYFHKREMADPAGHLRNGYRRRNIKRR